MDQLFRGSLIFGIEYTQGEVLISVRQVAVVGLEV
jgi:hypothetical protein